MNVVPKIWKGDNRPPRGIASLKTKGTEVNLGLFGF